MRLVILASGSGSNFEAIVKASIENKIDAEVCALICDKPNAYAIQRAKKYNINTHVVELAKCESKTSYEQKIVDILQVYEPDYICLAGYMKIVQHTILEKYEGKIINIHPSLLPKYPGNDAVNDAIKAGETEIGVTVHYVDHLVDNGEIIGQDKFPIDGLTHEQIFEQLHKKEHNLYVSVLKGLQERI